MGIEILLQTDRSLAGATRSVLDRLLGAGFENVDPPEDGRVELDCLDGESGEEWGLVAPETSAQDAFGRIKSAKSTVRVKVGLRTGQFILFPGFVVLSRPEDEYDDFEADPRARQIILREALEVARHFSAREIVVAGDAASDFIGTDATTWPALKEVLVEEDIPHRVLAVPGGKPAAG